MRVHLINGKHVDLEKVKEIQISRNETALVGESEIHGQIKKIEIPYHSVLYIVMEVNG